MMANRRHPGTAPSALLSLLSDGSCRTIGQLVDDLDLTNRQVTDAASCLLRRDYLMRMGIGCYQLTEAGIAAGLHGEIITSGPRGAHGQIRKAPNTLRQRAWRSMRMRRKFIVPDLVADAATERDRMPADNLHRYLRRLAQAGYVGELPRRVEGTSISRNGFKLWVLRRDTGPLAPIVLSKQSAMHDQNTGEYVPCAPRR